VVSSTFGQHGACPWTGVRRSCVPGVVRRFLDLLAARRPDLGGIRDSQDELTQMVEPHLAALAETSATWRRFYSCEPEQADEHG